MSVTVDCGEGKHDLCAGTGRTAYLFPQESRDLGQKPFACGCPCHHEGRGVPCPECAPTGTPDTEGDTRPAAKAHRTKTGHQMALVSAVASSCAECDWSTS
jgi:hypothetical protein